MPTSRYSPEEIQEAKAKLPESVRAFLGSPDFEKAILNIGSAGKLNLWGIAELTDAVTAVICGLEPESTFRESVEQRLAALSQSQKDLLVSEVDSHIFREIKNRLQRHTTPKQD
mgnify:CR=1 FL=1